jgi:hypothetical protein
MAEKEKYISSGRWWEHYFVRYFVGTVVGAAAILTLFPFLFCPIEMTPSSALELLRKVKATDLTLLAALGLAYCYIASAPFLTLHVARAELASTRWFWLAPIVVFMLIFGVRQCVLSLGWWTRESFGLLFMCVVVGGQIALLLSAHFNRFKRVADFYWALSEARSRDSRHVDDYVESYRHIREHGNAYSIIILELGFALSLASAPGWWLELLGLWLLPGAYCWVIGTVLESRLAHAPRA